MLFRFLIAKAKLAPGRAEGGREAGMSKYNLNETAKKIDDMVKMVKDKFDKVELESFIDYIPKTEAIAPLIVFEQWQKLRNDAFAQAGKRAKLLLKIKVLKDF